MIEYYSVIMDQMRKEGNHMKKLVGIIALLLALVFILTACGKEEKTSSASEAPKTTSSDKPAQESPSQPNTESPSADNESGISSTENQPAASSDGLEGTWLVTDVKTDRTDAESLETVKALKEVIASGENPETRTFKDKTITTKVMMRDSRGEWITSVEKTASYFVNGDEMQIMDLAEGLISNRKYKLDGNTLELEEYGVTIIMTRVE